MMKQIIEIWEQQGVEKIIEENPLNNYKLYFEGLMMNFAAQKQHSVHNESAYYFFRNKARLSVLLPKSGLYSM